MDFRFTPEEEAFQEEVRGFLDKELTPEICDKFSQVHWGPKHRQFLRKLGERGWLCPSWPKEYGGLGAPLMYRFILFQELLRRRAPVASIGASMAGPVIMMFGTEEQKREYLPRIARGEIEFALGYSETQAGSDLASLEIRAEEHGEYYVINGQKLFNTGANYAEYHWLGARTDPTVGKKHRGISLFIVDLKSPGITLRPLYTSSGYRTNEVFYHDVRVPKKNLVGEKNRGFYHIAFALALERSWPSGNIEAHFEGLLEYVRQIPSLRQDPLVRQKLAGLAIEVEVVRLLSTRVAWMSDKETTPGHEASMVKLLHSEVGQRLSNAAMQIFGLYGQLQEDSKWAPLEGIMEWRYRDSVVWTIYAGTSEIVRNIIAVQGLGLPRQ